MVYRSVAQILEGFRVANRFDDHGGSEFENGSDNRARITGENRREQAK
jgi:hypothetical protein